jgi:hypothetical protein
MQDRPQSLLAEALHAAVAPFGAPLRCRSRLEPAGGAADKVVLPTSAGAACAIERGRVPGRDEPVTCVRDDRGGDRGELA